MSSTIGIVRGADADAVWVVRDRVRFMGEVAGTDLAILEVEVPPGSGTPPHFHASPEIFRVLSGEITFGRFEDGPPTQVVAGAGTVVTVPSNVPHNYRNAGAAPASMLVVVERSMADFFRDLGRREAPPAGPPSEDEIAAVLAACARHEITIVGGAPAGAGPAPHSPHRSLEEAMHTMPPAFEAFDARLTRWTARRSITLLRISVGLVYLWFGVLKFFPGMSPAQDLASRTIGALTFGLVPAEVSVPLLAALETTIGLGLVSGRFLRATLLLLLAQMAGTVTPLLLFPGETFTAFPIAPTLEGQYIIKNVVLVSAAVLIGATVRGGLLIADPAAAREARAKEGR